MEYISKDLNENADELRRRFSKCEDLVFREIKLGGSISARKVLLVYFENMIDKNLIQENIIKPVTRTKYPDVELNAGKQLPERIKQKLLTACKLDERDKTEDMVSALLSGNTVLMIDGIDKGIIIYSMGWEKRGIEEPKTELAVRGAHDAFTEACGTNVTLIRRRIKDSDLKYIRTEVGKRSKTTVGLMYIEGIANLNIVNELKRRIDNIDIDGILESGYIEQLISDNPMSPFPQFRHTERPDEACASLLEGGILILCDNTPFVLMAPMTFVGLFQTIDDFSSNWYIATVIRLMRFVCAFLATALPAIYVAAVSYHPDMLPTDLVLSIASTREGVPFSPAVEALLMLIVLEILREAGVRMPTSFGQALGIVGSIVLGQAAVAAGIVSPVLVIIISINAIASFATANYDLAITFRLLTYVMLFLAAVAGLYGVYIGLLAIAIHLVKLKSVGIDYLSPFVNYRIGNGADTVYRASLKFLNRRPDYAMPLDKNRIGKY